MSGKPLIHVQIDDMARHVQSTMRRATDPFGESLIRMTGGLLMHCLRQHALGNPAHPGRKKMAAMGKCSEKQAQRNISILRNWLVMFPVSDEKGGRRATRYRLNLVALKRALVATGCNPSPDLFEKIDAVCASLRGDMRGDTRGDTMSHGIHTNITPSNGSGLRVIGGGRV